MRGRREEGGVLDTKKLRLSQSPQSVKKTDKGKRKKGGRSRQRNFPNLHLDPIVSGKWRMLVQKFYAFVQYCLQPSRREGEREREGGKRTDMDGSTATTYWKSCLGGKQRKGEEKGKEAMRTMCCAL